MTRIAEQHRLPSTFMMLSTAAAYRHMLHLGTPIFAAGPLKSEVLRADSDGRLTGADAVRFFERSGLPRDLLAKVGR